MYIYIIDDLHLNRMLIEMEKIKKHKKFYKNNKFKEDLNPIWIKLYRKNVNLKLVKVKILILKILLVQVTMMFL